MLMQRQLKAQKVKRLLQLNNLQIRNKRKKALPIGGAFLLVLSCFSPLRTTVLRDGANTLRVTKGLRLLASLCFLGSFNLTDWLRHFS